MKYFFIFLLIVPASYADQKHSVITTLYDANSTEHIQTVDHLKKYLGNDHIDDIHVIYDFMQDEKKVLNELEQLPVTIHFHNNYPSREFCIHIAQTICKNRNVMIDITDMPDENYCLKPRVSLIASLFNADEFVHDFMKNMTEQSIFDQTELIIINAHSPGTEEREILPYLSQFPNIVYIRLSNDPGLYAVWNMGITYAHAPLIGNANLDDRRDLYSLNEQVTMLENHTEYDLAYCDFCGTLRPNDQWYDMFVYQHTNLPQFSRQAIRYCLPGPQPVWRKAMHEKCGYFREDFVSSADQEMWCRAVHNGSQFIKLNCISGLYYLNPKGISTEPNCPRATRRLQEDYYVYYTYRHLWS